MRRFQLGVLFSLLSLSACGTATDDTPGGGGGPSTYTFVNGSTAQMIGAGTRIKAPFTLPVAGSAAYTITNRSTTDPDHWDISIVPASELGFFESNQPYMAYAIHSNVSTQSDTTTLAAGSYAIGIVCRNIIQDCQFSLDASMTY